MMTSFKRLVRFANPSGEVFYGELEDQTSSYVSLDGLKIPVYNGTAPWDESFALSSQIEEIGKILSPISNVPIFECVGVNYKAHLAETNLPHGDYPIIFTKPPDSLAGPFDDIPIHKDSSLLDYEAELCMIIGKDCKNVETRADAESCILGYTAGNDISSRFWQQPKESGGQFGFAKSFDKFAPLGPTILHPSQIDHQKGLRIRTFVNGELRQDGQTNDLVFDAPALIMHLTRGTTLRRGTVIMTGTPGGVGAFMTPPKYLENGDIVEVEIEKIGKMKNRMVFED